MSARYARSYDNPQRTPRPFPHTVITHTRLSLCAKKCSDNKIAQTVILHYCKLASWLLDIITWSCRNRGFLSLPLSLFTSVWDFWKLSYRCTFALEIHAFFWYITWRSLVARYVYSAKAFQSAWDDDSRLLRVKEELGKWGIQTYGQRTLVHWTFG